MLIWLCARTPQRIFWWNKKGSRCNLEIRTFFTHLLFLKERLCDCTFEKCEKEQLHICTFEKNDQKVWSHNGTFKELQKSAIAQLHFLKEQLKSAIAPLHFWNEQQKSTIALLKRANVQGGANFQMCKVPSNRLFWKCAITLSKEQKKCDSEIHTFLHIFSHWLFLKK